MTPSGGRFTHDDHAPGLGAQRTQAQGPSYCNIEINKQITGCGGARDLCALIEVRAAEFNHVNLATAFRKLLQSRRDGVTRDVERALQALDESALKNIEEFKNQALANTLHAMAKGQYTPANPLLLDALERGRG